MNDAETSPRVCAEVREPARLQELRMAIATALAEGDVARVRALVAEASVLAPVAVLADFWVQVAELEAWEDGWLVAAVRREPPDAEALDVLAARHWRSLYGRCRLLTLDADKAGDLAQDAWCRVLRARQHLRPDGNFSGYLAMIATNLWRDRHRAAHRAGAMAVDRLLSLEAPLPDGQGESSLAALLPDLATVQRGDQLRLKLDLDHALAQLPPLLHEVLVSRFLGGESCAEIGRRHGRTEQTVSGWIRLALQQMRDCLADTPAGVGGRSP